MFWGFHHLSMDESRVHSVEQPFWLLQMLPNAYRSCGLSQHFSNFNGTCFSRYDLENNSFLLGWPYHRRHIPWRAFRNTRRGTSTISWRRSQNKPIEMRVLQNKSPLFGTCPQRQWSTIRLRKNHCRGNVPYPYQSNRRHLVSVFLLKLPPLCWKLYRDCSITPQIKQSFLQLDTWGTGSLQNLSSRPPDVSNFIFLINEGTSDSLRNSSSTPPNDSHFSFPINERTFYFEHRRKLDCNGRCSRSGSKWQKTCHLLRF